MLLKFYKKTRLMNPAFKILYIKIPTYLCNLIPNDLTPLQSVSYG